MEASNLYTRRDKSEVGERSERNSEPREAGRKCNSPRWSCVSSVTLGINEKKGIGVRRSGAEEADSSRASFILRKLLANIQIKRAPVTARSVASLRSSPLSVGLRCVADAPSLRAQFHFFTIPKAAPLRGLPWAIVLSPRYHGAPNSARLRLAIPPSTSDLSDIDDLLEFSINKQPPLVHHGCTQIAVEPSECKEST